MGIVASILRMFAGPPSGLQRSNMDEHTGWSGGMSGNLQPTSGETVNESTAMGIAAWFAGSRNIAEDIGKLPKKLYRTRPDGGREAQTQHPVYRLIHSEPNPEMSAQSFYEVMIHHAISFRKGVAEIVRNGQGQPVALWPMDPTTIFKKRKNGRLIHEINGGRAYLEDCDVWEIHPLGFDGISGYRLVKLAAESLGKYLAAQRQSGAFFGNGAVPMGAFQFPPELKDDQIEVFRKSYSARHRGAGNAYKDVIIPGGGKYQQISVDPEKSQLTQTLTFCVEDVATWLRIPLSKLNRVFAAYKDSPEHENRMYVQDCLTQWAERIKQECARKLFTPGESGLYVETEFGAMLRGDMAGQAAYYKEMLGCGVLTINEVRALENRDPIGPEGDVHWIPTNNLAPADQAADQQAATAAACRPLIVVTMGRVLKKEANAIERAVSKHGEDQEGFDAWAVEFASGHRAEVVCAAGVCLRSLMLMDKGDCGEPLPAAIGTYVTEHMRRFKETAIGAACGAYGADGERDVDNQAEQAADELIELGAIARARRN